MMTLLAGAATVTERVRIEATVSITPMHAAVHVAKQAATIDVLSGGRFVLGVGVGGRDEDYRAMGVSFARRHATLDEQVAIMRRVWRASAGRRGRRRSVPRRCRPAGRRCSPAAMGPKSMARAARWADGVAGFDIAADPDGIAAGVPAVRGGVGRGAGREGRPFLQTSFWFGLGADAPDRVRDYAFRYLRIFGDDAAHAMAGLCDGDIAPKRVRDRLTAIEDTGCDEVDPRRDDRRHRRPAPGRRRRRLRAEPRIRRTLPGQPSPGGSQWSRSIQKFANRNTASGSVRSSRSSW